MARIKRTPVSIEHLNEGVQKMIEGKTDREVAILGGALLEGMLFDLLSEVVVDSLFQRSESLFDYPKPLNSFGNMLSLAFAFGVISELEFNSVSVIKNIRNYAAHSIGLAGDDFSFAKEPVRGMLFEFYPKFAVKASPKEMQEQIRRDFDRLVDRDAKMAYRLVFCDAELRLLARRTISKPLTSPGEINEGAEDSFETLPVKE